MLQFYRLLGARSSVGVCKDSDERAKVLESILVYDFLCDRIVLLICAEYHMPELGTITNETLLASQSERR